MGQVNDRVSCLVYLMEDEITEEFDDISVTGFGPPRLTRKSAQKIYNEA